MAADEVETTGGAEARLRRLLGPSVSGGDSPASPAFARALDAAAPSPARGAFRIPAAATVASSRHKSAPSQTLSSPEGDRKEAVYLCGNSLGLQPEAVRSIINQELDVWADFGVEGHFNHPHGRPWVSTDDNVIDESARIVGALPEEVAIMNSLTVNLHLLMVAFYRPVSTRYKILFESRAFPSDAYALESQVKFHGFNPDDALIVVSPRPGEHTLRTSDILDIIARQGHEIALVMFSGVQYYTGQAFEMGKITAAAKAQGCTVGFDLAHAVGNIILQLHDWDVDFACWCTYKYLNAGPGGIGGAFMHKQHHQDKTLQRFAGWWGADPSTRFDMSTTYTPIIGANSLRLSNPCVLAVMSLHASLQVFAQTNMSTLRARSVELTGYLELLLDNMIARRRRLDRTDESTVSNLSIITPRDPDQRGCQLSLLFDSAEATDRVLDALIGEGIVCDARKPDVIRVAPAPLYNTFEDVQRFVAVIDRVL